MRSTNGSTTTVAVITAAPSSSDRRGGSVAAQRPEGEPRRACCRRRSRRAGGRRAPRWPASSANATALISTAPNTPPTKTITAISGGSPALRSADGCAVAVRGDGGGSLARWADQRRRPGASRTPAASSPACGATRVASTRDDQRPEHEDQLVEHRLEGVGRAEPRVVPRARSPSGPAPATRSTARAAPPTTIVTHQRPGRCVAASTRRTKATSATQVQRHRTAAAPGAARAGRPAGRSPARRRR